MKAVFVGGGSHRLIGILRGAMNIPGVLDGGEVALYDLDPARAEVVARLVMKSPEWRRCRCEVTWGMELEEALDGADVVGVVLKPGGMRSWLEGHVVSLRHGILTSDNLSPNGTFMAVKGGQFMMQLARTMERYCPNAWLVDFANPIAVFSAMVNHHSAIRCLGVCGGYTNHMYDLMRLRGVDEPNTDSHVHVAGINHLSFIVGGTFGGRDPFEIVRDAAADPDFAPPALQPWRPEEAKKRIRNSVTHLVELWRDFGVLLFSTESDGSAHLYPDRSLVELSTKFPTTMAEVEARMAAFEEGRVRADQRLRALADDELTDEFWEHYWTEDSTFRSLPDNIFIRVLQGIAGHEPVEIVTTRPNEGAIAGIADHTVVEYAQVLRGDSIEPAVTDLRVPQAVEGIVGALASYQTHVADALAREDPFMLAHALLSYPHRAYTEPARDAYRELIAINREQIPEALHSTVDYL